MIHPVATVDPKAEIGEGVEIGPYTVIEKDVSIGEGTKIGPHVVIREFVTLHRGTIKGGGKTVIGNDNFFMAYAHVAHDCQVGNQVVFSNGATLAGHIIVEDYAIIGGLSAIHQFCRVGTHALISGLTGVPLDIPPYMIAAGSRAKLYGLNAVGLKRHHFSEETMKALKKAYRIIFRSGLTLENAMKKVGEDEISQMQEVQHLLQFIQRSKRGISR